MKPIFSAVFEYSGVTLGDIYFTTDSAEKVTEIIKSLREKLKPYLVPKKEKIRIDVKFVFFKNGDINVSKKTVYIKDNIENSSLYPEDLPEKDIVRFLKSDDSGIIIFKGVPGGGKSTFIKHLIFSNPSLTFSIISGGSPESLSLLKNHILENTSNQIFVIEDCERILTARAGNNQNSFMSDFLNISDGIIGDLCKTKFILTFNSAENIDPALLRKGRMKFMYEFKPVTGARLEELAKNVGIELTQKDREKGLTLAEIFNYTEKDYGKKSGKIGF